MTTNKGILYNEVMLKAYGCVNCIWKAVEQCPLDFKSGTGDTTDTGYCDKLTDFLNVLAEGEDSISAVKEKFHLFVQEVQVLDDRKRFVKLQKELDDARKSGDKSRIDALEMRVNQYKVWWARLSESVVKSLARIADREAKSVESRDKPLTVRDLNKVLADNAKVLLEDKK